MIIFKQPAKWQKLLENGIGIKDTVGFIPTMGALHKGHLSLLSNAKTASTNTIASIFINPTQFNDPEDFKKYPHTLEADIHQLESAKLDYLFLPPPDSIYSDGIKNLEVYDLGYLDTILEGKFRPGHFQGVCQVMNRLIGIIQPHKIFMGQKDYQQCMVIQKLIDANFPRVELVICPTVREHDGLAMSSRNLRLNEQQRKKAPALFEALQFLRDNLVDGDVEQLKNDALAILNNANFRVDYLEICDAQSLQSITNWDGKLQTVAVAAAFLDDVRLIDNMMLDR